MRYRSTLLPTLKEAPSGATSASHVYLFRAGFVRQVGAGIYSFLPLGVRVLRKVEAVIRQELDRAGANEVLLPALLPADYFKETDRWDLFGDTLLRLKDRKGGDYHLGPTHEEIITDLARREVKSYRDLPQNLYQVQNKFRDEPRPRGGLLRCREFIMKDAYSFDATEDEARGSYEKMRLAYNRIFRRMGFDYRMVSADSGAMGGSGSAEFQILVQSGEDIIAACKSCEHAANVEVAGSLPLPARNAERIVPTIEKLKTPGKKTIEKVADFMGGEPADFLKSLVFVARKDDGSEEVVLAVVRGDHELNEIKLARALGVAEVALATPDQVKEATGAVVGFAGPVGFDGRVLIDRDAGAVHDAIAGANDSGFHIKHVEMGRDFEAEVHDLRNVVEGDRCPHCDGGELGLYRGIEAGHIFLLGTHYSSKMNATFLDEKGDTRPLVMGCYGIGVSRLVAAAVEQHHDDQGIRWPLAIAPYQVHLVQLGWDDEVKAVVDRLEADLEARGVEVLVDDREERPGVKFKDADLIGIPFRLTVGGKGLAKGIVEWKSRTQEDPRASEALPVDGAVDAVLQRLEVATDG